MDQLPSDHWQLGRILAASVGLLCVVGILFWLGSEDARSTTARAASTQSAEVPPSVAEETPIHDTPVSEPAAEQAATLPTISPVVVAAEATRKEELKAQFVGVWFHAENGEQWIENRSDGTSRMLLKLDFVASLLYGKQTAMELKWDVTDGVLSHTVVSGSPQKNVDSLTKDFGQACEYVILEMTPERMLLETKDEKKKKDLWTRMPAPQEWAVQTPKTEKPEPAGHP